MPSQKAAPRRHPRILPLSGALNAMGADAVDNFAGNKGLKAASGQKNRAVDAVTLLLMPFRRSVAG